MVWKASWIWLANNRETVNICALARKTFKLNPDYRSAEIAITADTRYRLFVNGERFNDGPARSYPWKYSYDEIDITSLLKPGENVLAVVVNHWGYGSFQSNVCEPGLLAQLKISYSKETEYVISDASWKMIAHPGYDSLGPRASHHIGFEEHLDARHLSGEWMKNDFDDKHWAVAKEICSAMKGPWKSLTPRDIPLLAYEPVRPKRMISSRYIKQPKLVETIDITHHLWPGDKKLGARNYRCAMAANIVSKSDQQARIYRPSAGVELGLMKLNGQVIDFNLNSAILTDEYRNIHLAKGINPMFVVFDGCHYVNDFQIIIDAADELECRNPFGCGSVALTHQYEEGDPEWETIKCFDAVDHLYLLEKYFAVAKPLVRRSVDVHANTCFSTTLDGRPSLSNVETMFADQAQSATISPSNKDVEIILDFDCEYNMYIGFEIEAPENVIIDGYVFEKYWNNKPQHTWRHRASFRYITRKGWQRYLSNRSFGGRYMCLTFRNLTAAVQIKKVYGEFKHYPVSERGRIYSDNDKLNTIWDVCRHTLLCCMEDTFIDCPTYEQACWVGDGRNEALACQRLFGDPRFLRRCISLPSLSLGRSDLTESQIPSTWDNIIPVWSFLWVKAVWEYYWFTGDMKTLTGLYPYITKMLRNCIEKYTDPKNGLFCINAWNFFDWAGMDAGHRCVTHNNIFLVDAFRTTALMAKETGKNSDTTKWSQHAEKIKSRINRHLWSKTRNAYIDSIHDDGITSDVISQPTNTLALLYGIAPLERQKKILPIAMGTETKDIVPFGSPFAYFYLLEYLACQQQYGTLLDVIQKKWGSMLDGETTTFWESFRDGTLGGKYPTRSYCHAWSAGPAYIYSRYIIGVQWLSPGGKKIQIQPQLSQLKSVKATVPCMAGDLSVAWNTRGKTVTLNITLPDDVEARFKLPEDMKIAKLNVNDKTSAYSYQKGLKLPNHRSICIKIVVR
jgi:hypothetical protein